MNQSESGGPAFGTRSAISSATASVTSARPTSQQAIGAAMRSESCDAVAASARIASDSASLGGSIPSSSAKAANQSAALLTGRMLPGDGRETGLTVALTPLQSGARDVQINGDARGDPVWDSL